MASVAPPAASCGAASALPPAAFCAEAAAVVKPPESDANVTPPASSVAGSSTSGSSSGGESSGGDSDELTKAKADKLFVATQSRTWRDALLAIDEESGACSEIVFASDVAPEVFAALISRHDALPKSMRYDAHTREVVVSDLALARHGIPIAVFTQLAKTYSRAQGGRRALPASGDFSFLGDLSMHFGGIVRAPDATMQPRNSTTTTPVLVVEVGALESVAQLDDDAQMHLGCPLLNGEVQAVLFIRVFKRRPSPTAHGAVPGPYAAVAALYVRGNGPGAGRSQALAEVPGAAGPVFVVPTAPSCVISFGSAPVHAGPCRAQVEGLGTVPTGVGFGGPACDRLGLAAYRIRVPAAVLYFASPPPAGMLAAAVPDATNDWTIDLFEFVDALDTAVAFRAGE